MADKKGIGKLDEKLVSLKIIGESLLGELPLVHRKMNSILKKTGAVLSDDIFETGNAALRKWLLLLSKQGASQEKLTAYLRCGLAHLTYDFIESQYRQIDPDDLVTRTLMSLKNRKLHTSFFKPSVETAKAAPKKKPAAGKKIVAIKKTAVKAKPKADAKVKPKAAAKSKPKAKPKVKAKPKAAVKAKPRAKK